MKAALQSRGAARRCLGAKDPIKVYREPGGVYLLVLVGNGKTTTGMYDCLGDPMYPGNQADPMLAHAVVDPEYLHRRCKRVAWGDLPEVWRREFAAWYDTAGVA